MTFLITYAPLLLQGICVTICAWFVAGLSSFILGVTFGILGCRNFAYKKTTLFINMYTFIAKGVPAYVHILIAYFALPGLFGISIHPFIAATGALALCSGGYSTEIIRAGIHAVPEGQWNACFVLGYSRYQALTRVILPQAIKKVLPALLGECEQLLKSTSLLATIGVTELTRAGMNIISRELNPLPVYVSIAFIYLFFSAVMHSIIFFVQRRKRI